MDRNGVLYSCNRQMKETFLLLFKVQILTIFIKFKI